MISCSIFNFGNQFSGINNTKSLNISRMELAWGIVSLGHTGWRDIFHGFSQDILGIVSLATEILGNTKETGSGFLVTSRRYGLLVDTDLQTATYRLGAALAKCVASRTIGVHWLQHTKPLIDRGVITLMPGANERPDYVGEDNLGGWHSIEAKGRSNPPGLLIRDAKRQATRVSSINKAVPVTSCGCVAHLYRSPIHVEFCDPRSNQSGSEDIILEIDKKRYVEEYYAYFVDLIYERAKFTSLEIETNLGDVEYMIPLFARDKYTYSGNIRYGIYKKIYELISAEELSSYSVASAVEFLENIQSKNQKSHLGTDGTLLLFDNIAPARGQE